MDKIENFIIEKKVKYIRIDGEVDNNLREERIN